MVKLENEKVSKYVLFPLFFIVFVLIVLIREWVFGGMVAFALLAFSYVIYDKKKFQKYLIGIPKHIFQGWQYGLGLLVFFLGLMFFSNNSLSIAVPTLPQAVFDFSLEPFILGTPISLIIVVIIFPFAETCWKSSLLAILMGMYKLSKLKAIILTGIIFGSVLHIFAYGVVLAAASTFGVALQQINSISGVLFTASLFGMLASWVLLKTKNFFMAAIPHSIINYSIVSVALAIIQFI